MLKNYNTNSVKEYLKLLNITCSLSKLYSESDVPFLYYRAAENIFCKAFKAENLSRTDTAYDAKISNTGIGIKTFISISENKSEKISEFNEYSHDLRLLPKNDLPFKLAELRNNRINFANRTYGIENAIYHCISRRQGKLYIFETTYDLMDIDSIKTTKADDKSIHFEDKYSKYSFLYSKSTLFKNFIIPKNSLKHNINIIEDPYEFLLKLFEVHFLDKKVSEPTFEQIPGKDFVFLPLYSTRFKEKYVPEKSGLNQWNAAGRKRDPGEVYIPVPREIHKQFPEFFPSRDKVFNLHVPTGEILIAKLCQENSKALITNPNNALSDWLLRKVFRLKEKQILKYDTLKSYGIDSVLISKIDKNNFKIEFANIDSYSNFINVDNSSDDESF